MNRWVVAGAALAFVALTLAGCGSSGKSIPPIGNMYLDNSLKQDNTLAGWRLVTDQNGIVSSKEISILGTDDGHTFWNVRGNWTDKDNGKFIANFVHRDGAQGKYDFQVLEGTVDDDGITFNGSMAPKLGSTQWQSMKNANVKLAPSKLTVTSKPGGLYKDDRKYVDGTYQGLRMIADNFWPNLTIAGTDDGTNFWKIQGYWDAVPGQFYVDMSPLDGPQNVTAHPNGNELLWGDGTYWQKMNASGAGIAKLVKTLQV